MSIHSDDRFITFLQTLIKTAQCMCTWGGLIWNCISAYKEISNGEILYGPIPWLRFYMFPQYNVAVLYSYLNYECILVSLILEDRSISIFWSNDKLCIWYFEMGGNNDFGVLCLYMNILWRVWYWRIGAYWRRQRRQLALCLCLLQHRFFFFLHFFDWLQWTSTASRGCVNWPSENLKVPVTEGLTEWRAHQGRC